MSKGGGGLEAQCGTFLGSKKITKRMSADSKTHRTGRRGTETGRRVRGVIRREALVASMPPVYQVLLAVEQRAVASTSLARGASGAVAQAAPRSCCCGSRRPCWGGVVGEEAGPFGATCCGPHS